MDLLTAFGLFAVTPMLVLPSGNDGLILAQPVSGFASMVQRKGLAMVRLK